MGPAIVQAIALGHYDIMHFGIGSTLVARGNGMPIKVVASNVIEQIAGIARALAIHPELLLMDEPFGAFDAIPPDAVGRVPAHLARDRHDHPLRHP